MPDATSRGAGRIALYGATRPDCVVLCLGCAHCERWRSAVMMREQLPAGITIENYLFAQAKLHGWCVQPPRCPDHALEPDAP